MRVTALAGGVGGSKLLLGLARALPPGDLTAVVNTGDDIELHGLWISPDLDIVTYTLAGAVNPQTGWGIQGDTFRVLDSLERLGHEPWFHLGDVDLATHLHRTGMLRSGATLSQAADSIRRALDVAVRILPMSDQKVRTMLATDRGRLHLQEYLVRERTEPVVREIAFEGIEAARPAPGVLEAIDAADLVILGPSNPLISIGPILAVPGLSEALRSRADRVIAVSPIVGGRSLKGPSDKMLAQMGREASALGVAKFYAGLAGTYVIDNADAAQRPAIEALGYRVVVTRTVMTTLEDKERLARELLALAPVARDARA
jgi:LPPG:FO 2-phospho-L-lactate transferase